MLKNICSFFEHILKTYVKFIYDQITASKFMKQELIDIKKQTIS